MRTIPVSLKKVQDGSSGFAQRNVIDRKAFGFRINPLIDPILLSTDRQNVARPIPGIFPVKATIRRKTSGNFETTFWLYDDSWVDVPNGFDSLDIECPGAFGGEIQSNLPSYLVSNFALAYRLDYSDHLGERMGKPSRRSLGTVMLATSGAIPILSTLPTVPGSTVLTSPGLAYHVTTTKAWFAYIFEQYRTIKIVLQAGAPEDITLWVSDGASGTSEGDPLRPAEVIPAANWIAQNDGSGLYALVISRDCYFANEWIALTSATGTPLSLSMIATYEN